MKRLIKNKDIVLYGLSTETERILTEWNGKHNIIGLLDGFQNSGHQFGYPILDINNVVKMKNIVIIVVARPGSCKAIAKRIGGLCKENDVPLFDIRGKNLLVDTRIVYDFKSLKNYTKADILEQAKDVQAVSFDLFDTLVVRDVLSARDVVELVNVRLIEKGICIEDFLNKRIAVEKQLSQGHAPRLYMIYEEILNLEDDLKVDALELSDLEYELELGLLQPRKEMIKLLTDIKNIGKQVYITSESYYTKSQINHILERMGINDIDDIVVSCEYDTGKTGDLFDCLTTLAGTKDILHIGDDIVADIESARRHGLQSFQIYSASELLESVGGLGLISGEMSLSDRIRIGMFIAKIFNSPFQFEDEEMRIHVDDVYDIGYLFTAPMIMDFTIWFGKQVNKYDLKNIWFCARDGYLLQKIYSILFPGADSEYYYTSRISAIRAGMDDISDVEYVDSMKYSGDVLDNLRTRFGIDEKILDLYKTDETKEGLLKYTEAILDISKRKKANNLKYIQKLHPKDGGIAFFDFVAKGTSQMYIQRLVENRMNGLYFLQLEPEFMKDKGLNILPFYKEEEKESSAIFDNYYILETLLTAPEASLDEFDESGNPVYAKEMRSETDVECFMRAQEGILSYVRRYLSICPEQEISINKRLDETFLFLVNKVDIRNKSFLALTVEDPFFNRMTDIKDVL